MREAQPRATKSAVRVAIAATLAIACLGGTAYAFGVPDVLRPFDPSLDSSDSTLQMPPSSLSIRSVPRTQTVQPGTGAKFKIRIRRGSRRYLIGRHGKHRIAAGVSLSVPNPPDGIRAKLRPARTRTMASSLALSTTSETAPGTYRLRLRARGHLRPAVNDRVRISWASTIVTLVVSAPETRDFDVQGTALGLLSPGNSVPVDVHLTNAHESAMTVDGLAMSIDGVEAPDATSALPCTASDFVVEQYSVDGAIEVQPSSTATLESLGVPRSEWPRIQMTNSSANQDGCKGATLRLGFSATSIGGDS